MGVEQNFRDSFLTSYVVYTRAYLSADAQITPRIGVVGGLDFASETFRGQETRHDLLLTVRSTGSYRVREWVSVGVGATWQRRWSTDPAVTYSEGIGNVSVSFVY